MPMLPLQAERAFDQVVEWLEHFEVLDDPRQQGKVWYPLDEVLLLCLVAVLAGAEGWVEVAEFGEAKLDFLRRFRSFEKGTPSHDQLGDLFAALDAEQFQSCFIAWVGSLMISAWSCRQRLVLGQAKVAEKSNGITAIPDLLDLLTIKAAVVTIDAMGCQKEIGRKIREKGADYVLALKGNQGTLSEDVELFFAEQKARKFKDAAVSRHQTLEKSHGRIETRTYAAVGEIDWLKERHDWDGLESIVMVESIREIIGGKTERETRFYISSLAANAEIQGEAIRSHWGVENSHHWVMDMVFRDDECRIRKANAPANFAVIKHIASNLLRRGSGKHSLRVKRRLAAWNDNYLANLIAGG